MRIHPIVCGTFFVKRFPSRSHGGFVEPCRQTQRPSRIELEYVSLNLSFLICHKLGSACELDGDGNMPRFHALRTTGRTASYGKRVRSAACCTKSASNRPSTALLSAPNAR